MSASSQIYQPSKTVYKISPHPEAVLSKTGKNKTPNNKVWINVIFYCLNIDFCLPWLFKDYLKACQQNLWKVEFKVHENLYLIFFCSWLFKHEKMHTKIHPHFFLNFLPLFFSCLSLIVLMKILSKWRRSTQIEWTVIFTPITKMRNHCSRYSSMIAHIDVDECPNSCV